MLKICSAKPPTLHGYQTFCIRLSNSHEVFFGRLPLVLHIRNTQVYLVTLFFGLTIFFFFGHSPQPFFFYHVRRVIFLRDFVCHFASKCHIPNAGIAQQQNGRLTVPHFLETLAFTDAEAIETEELNCAGMLESKSQKALKPDQSTATGEAAATLTMNKGNSTVMST